MVQRKENLHSNPLRGMTLFYGDSNFGGGRSKALQAYFSDLIFELPFKRQDLECNICLLFEQKSEVPTNP
jgi:hypothetical protein